MTTHERYLVFSSAWEMLKELRNASFNLKSWEEFISKSNMIYESHRDLSIPRQQDADANFVKKIFLAVADEADRLQIDNTDKHWKEVSVAYNGAWKFYSQFAEKKNEFLQCGVKSYYQHLTQLESEFSKKLLDILYFELCEEHHFHTGQIIHDLLCLYVLNTQEEKSFNMDKLIGEHLQSMGRYFAVMSS